MLLPAQCSLGCGEGFCVNPGSPYSAILLQTHCLLLPALNPWGLVVVPLPPTQVQTGTWEVDTPSSKWLLRSPPKSKQPAPSPKSRCNFQETLTKTHLSHCRDILHIQMVTRDLLVSPEMTGFWLLQQSLLTVEQDEQTEVNQGSRAVVSRA